MQRWVGIGLLFVVGCGSRDAEPTDPVEPAAASEPRVEATVAPAPRFDGLEGFWDEARARAVLDRAATFEVRADTSGWSDAERAAAARLMEAGLLAQRLHEEMRHAEALDVRAHLETYAPEAAPERAQLESLRTLYRLFQGPIATMPDGSHVAFAPVAPYEPARNVYPTGLDRAAMQAYVDAHPGDRALTATRTIVRRRTAEQLEHDRAALAAHPEIAALHPRLAEQLAADADDDALYAVPYALAHAGELGEMSRLLFAAAGDVRADDADLADYLEQRARDLLSNDYEAGDAAWVSGRFGRLNAQVGAYETYDDHVLGQKAFYSLSILARAPEESEALERAVAHLSELEAALPGGPYERVRTAIPIGIYDVVADYGQARGANTASILPNEAHITRKYGRTILVRRNVIMHPEIVAASQRRFRAAVATTHADDLGERGSFDRTVWHEVGHYLGPKTTTAGQPVTEALGGIHNCIEELKADLVSLWLLPRLVELGVLDAERQRDAYAAGVLRVLVSHEPPRTEAYGTMQLMQQNWLLERRVLSFDAERGLTIDYARYPAAVEAMLVEVLRIQRAGDAAAAQRFIDRWARWSTDVQAPIAARMEGIAPRYWIPSYAALEEPATP
ncbi:MAG: NUDIX hydrolase [Myxococcota bacterium]|nr:NUDIX hydrolase [Myxococcota bacterium]